MVWPWITASALVAGATGGAPQIELSRRPDGYVLRARFSVGRSPACVLKTLFASENLRASAGASTEVELLEDGPRLQRVRYTERRLGMTVRQTYRRALDEAASRLDVELLESEASSLLPTVKSSRGFYKVEPGEGGHGAIVVYEQSVELEGVLAGAMVTLAEGEARNFVEGVAANVERLCDP